MFHICIPTCSIHWSRGPLIKIFCFCQKQRTSNHSSMSPVSCNSVLLNIHIWDSTFLNAIECRDNQRKWSPRGTAVQIDLQFQLRLSFYLLPQPSQRLDATKTFLNIAVFCLSWIFSDGLSSPTHIFWRTCFHHQFQMKRFQATRYYAFYRTSLYRF